MCRIAGIFDPTNLNLQEDILKMRDAMHRGGPDDAGLFIDGSLALGHRRLSIIDLSADGHQPMLNSDGSLVVCYNGEIYNFKEIKEELRTLGHSFHSKTDTEVILAGYAQWNTGIFKKLNGMFALAIYDKGRGELILARDHAGIKPLYYFFEEGKLYFASEIRAFKALNRFEENPDWRIYFLAFGHLPEPITTLSNVRPLEKGTYVRFAIARDQKPETRDQRPELSDLVNSNISAQLSHCVNNVEKSNLVSGIWYLESKKFAQFTFTNTITTTAEAIEKVRSTLEAAVQRHLISDAPIGLFLSGGIDSSLLTILAQPHLKDKLRTLSIYFDDEKYSEKEYQDIIIKQTGARHQSFKVTEEDFRSNLPDALEAMDQPTTDGINTYFICKYAKQAGLTAVLSGLGADEFFGGYNSFSNQKRIELLQHFLPEIAFKTAQLANKDKYQKIAFLSIPGPVGQYLFHRGLLCPKEIAYLLDVQESKVWTLLNGLNDFYRYQKPDTRYQMPYEHTEGDFEVKDSDNLSVSNSKAKTLEKSNLVSGLWSLVSQWQTLASFNNASWLEQTFYMQNQLLKDSDFMSMWHSIEIRVPFLDKELIQLACQIDMAIKAGKGQKKILLIHALGDKLPRAIWNRPKMGFTFPFQRWLASDEEARGEKQKTRKENSYAERKFLTGGYSWSRFWANKLVDYKISNSK